MLFWGYGCNFPLHPGLAVFWVTTLFLGYGRNFPLSFGLVVFLGNHTFLGYGRNCPLLLAQSKTENNSCNAMLLMHADAYE
jgi:hypothetical protein